MKIQQIAFTIITFTVGVVLEVGAQCKYLKVDIIDDLGKIIPNTMVVVDTVTYIKYSGYYICAVNELKKTKVNLSIYVKGFKPFQDNITLKKDTTILVISLTRATILLPEVGITAGRLSNEQTKESFNALDYFVDDSVVLILGKSGNKLQLRLYNPSLMLRSIGEVPFADLQLLVNCNRGSYLYNEKLAFRIQLFNGKVHLIKDVSREDIKQYTQNPCILVNQDRFFYKSVNRFKTTHYFYYTDHTVSLIQLFFVISNDALESEIRNFMPNVHRATPGYVAFDPTNPIIPIELSKYLDQPGMTQSVNRVNDARVYVKKILIDGNSCYLFHQSNQFHILDMQKLEYHSIDTGYTRCNSGSFSHLAAGGKWSKKFFADEEYSRLFTTYVQGDTRVVEVKGEKLEETKTVANIPFNGYFPEKIKIRGPYLYYLMFDGKKRVLYKEKMESY
jgi:hypothetical protein